jgi:hypothetical protein
MMEADARAACGHATRGVGNERPIAGAGRKARLDLPGKSGGTSDSLNATGGLYERTTETRDQLTDVEFGPKWRR